MKIKEAIARIEAEYPKSAAESWDNPGLLVGDAEAEVSSVLVALDAVDEVIDEAVKKKVQLLVTHHPMIFSAVRQINNDSLTGRRVLKLIRNGIACYAMHTNFDVRGMAALNEQQLGLTDTRVLYETGEEDGMPEGIGRVGLLPEPMEYEDLARFVKKALGIHSVRCYGEAGEKIRKVAVSGGSGKSMVEKALEAGAQVLVTGDIDYHTGIDAAAEGLRIIDAGHFGTEQVFIPFMKEKLSVLLPECRVYAARQKPPFTVI